MRSSNAARFIFLYFHFVALELLILWPGLQEPTGSALPASGKEELDDTSSDSLSISEPEHTAISVASFPADSAGWSVVQKLVIFSVIVGGVAIFLRTRKRRVVGEKNLA